MRWSEKYRPKTLDDVVGQPSIRMLKALAREPYSCCLLLECENGGVGKTSAAIALANEIGCQDEFSGLHIVPCSEFSIELAREMFDNRLHLRPMMGNGWHCVVLEEFDWLPAQTQRFLKVALETRLPSKCVVVATSNGTGKLDRALFQRFHRYRFESKGQAFQWAIRMRLCQIWNAETGSGLPPDFMQFGKVDDSYSVRVALDEMQEYYMTSHLAVS